MIKHPLVKRFFPLLLSLCLFASVAAQEPPQIDTAELDRRAALLMNQLEMTGLAMAVVENGKISFAKGYGEELRDSGQLVTADTVFRWASVSKGVAANTLLSVVEDGQISLADTAESLAPSLKLPGETDPNLVHLLSHQTGIVRNAYDNRIEAGKPAKLTRTALNDLGVLCQPGTCHTYQNVAYDAAAEIIEAQTGLPYKSIVQTRVFDPLGMDSASVTLEGLTRSKRWARPHGRFGKRIKSVKPTYYRVPAAAGVNSSVTDLAKWMSAQFPEQGQIPIDRLAAMQTPIIQTRGEQRFLNRRFGDLQNAHYGLGWRVYNYHGHKVVGHRGGVDGYRALVMFDPEKQAGIALMWNSPHSRPIGLQMEFLDQLYGLPKRDWLRLKESS
ncbi:serine hydrolase [Litorimonas cladophorae]|uniref:Serine hydrolase n=1 Tax=Litorimonas cladophorae TaxID=1220491 RepID=A0A918KJX1_9PROT|nr:serine hydrolase domain-containing protein [Litorimonas cladophorae]GGX65985.1 serine hydrolase [Litorimonas cladophorae]